MSWDRKQEPHIIQTPVGTAQPAPSPGVPPSRVSLGPGRITHPHGSHLRVSQDLLSSHSPGPPAAAGQGPWWEVNGHSVCYLEANLQPESDVYSWGPLIQNPKPAWALLHPQQAGRGRPGGGGASRLVKPRAGRFQKGAGGSGWIRTGLLSRNEEKHQP